MVHGIEGRIMAKKWRGGSRVERMTATEWANMKDKHGFFLVSRVPAYALTPAGFDEKTAVKTQKNYRKNFGQNSVVDVVRGRDNAEIRLKMARKQEK